jgi:tRNA modification GTPase
MNTTIAAVATAAGPGGVGVVRISGPRSKAIAAQFLGKTPALRHAHFSAFRDADGQVIDHGLLIFFAGPHSFTGEDVLELQGHGSPMALALLLKRCLELGAAPARAGEFSERAFLNGKMDLAQAEAVADLIGAQSSAAAMAAVRSLEGAFSHRVNSLLRELVELRKYVEALIDFPDEEIDFSHYQQIDQRNQQLQLQLATLLEGARAGQRLRDGLYVVILGPPNAGKSSLLNAMAQTDSAIVTPIAGTTRDVLREQIEIAGVPVTLVDTAGLRDSTNIVEAEGIRRAHAQVHRADVLLLLLGADQAQNFASLRASLPAEINTPILCVRNKSDLPPASDASTDAPAVIRISSKTGAGLDALKTALLEAGKVFQQGGTEGGFSARLRHVHALEQVQSHLYQSAICLANKQSELAAEDLRLAQNALSGITGAFTADDLLGQIFSSFCIGK